MPEFLSALRQFVSKTVSPEANTKSATPGALLSWHTPGRAVWAPRDYQAFAREGFMENPVVYRSVRMIAEAAASIPLALYENGVDLDTHPLLDLLANPCPDHTATDLLESWYGYLLVAGNSYIKAVAVGGEVRELHALRPDRMKVIQGQDGWPDGFEYTRLMVKA